MDWKCVHLPFAQTPNKRYPSTPLLLLRSPFSFNRNYTMVKAVFLPILCAIICIAMHGHNVFGAPSTPLSTPHLEARDKYLQSLPKEIRQEYEKRYIEVREADYEVWLEQEHQLTKRDGPTPSPGIKNCVNGNTMMTYDDGPYTWTKELVDLYSNAGMHMT